MELVERNDAELKKLAKDFKIDTKGMKKMDIVEAIEKAAVKHKLKLEAQARAELSKEAEEKLRKLGFDSTKQRKPSPETIAIEGGIDPETKRKVPPSKKKYYIFHNLEEEGVRIALRKGEKYRFELFDGKIHVLPDWLVRNLRLTAVFPLYDQRKNPVTGLEESVHVGNRPRFSFEELEDAPKDSEFGVVIDKALEQKYLQPVLN